MGSTLPMSALRMFRIISVVEGLSLLLLVGVAMPLKYIWHRPEAVRVVGMAHGVLFVGFAAALLAAHLHARWSMSKTVVLFIASFFPFGFVFIDRQAQLANEQEPGPKG
jgi:integral membrane protein